MPTLLRPSRTAFWSLGKPTLALLLLAPALASAQISIHGLGFFFGGSFSTAAGVSVDGSVVVGQAASSGPDYAFRWTAADDAKENIIRSPFTSGLATGVSADGSVVVGQGGVTPPGGAFWWGPDDGDNRIINLGTFTGGTGSSALAVSADGSVVVGWSNGTDINQHAFRWENGVMTDLGEIDPQTSSVAYAVSADGSVVVGQGYVTGSGGRAFRWTAADQMVNLGTLPGGGLSTAYGVSADGTFVVGYSTASDGHYAFRWHDNQMENIGRLTDTANTVEARGVSADGTIVVGQSDTTAFIWIEGQGMVALFDYLSGQSVDLTHWQSFSDATAITPDGTTIVGYGINSSNYTEAFIIRGLNITAVPEPATYALLVGAAALLLTLWRRRGIGVTRRVRRAGSR